MTGLSGMSCDECQKDATAALPRGGTATHRVVTPCALSALRLKGQDMLKPATTSKATALHPCDLQRHPTGTAGRAPLEATNDGEARD